MIELKGKNGTAKVFTDSIEEKAKEQIVEALNSQITENTIVRIMPDVHAGAGCVIGTTIKLPENKSDWKICPNIIGVDIGCGVLGANIVSTTGIRKQKLDETIKKNIPAGFNVHEKVHRKLKDQVVSMIDGARMPISEGVKDRAIRSMGTLGGGNHFIELCRDEWYNFVITVHTGSRNFGKQIADYYQDLATKRLKDVSADRSAIVERLKAEGCNKDIESAIKEYDQSRPKVTKGLEYLTGQDAQDYMNDMRIAQRYAELNRRTILMTIAKYMKFGYGAMIESAHNFIDGDIIRKGATSARRGEKLIIPLNMRDGSLICVGKGNPDWNYSAPHGAGRLMSRMRAKEELTMEDFKKAMEGVYSTTVAESTLDEAPMAYKDASEIIASINDTATIGSHIKPVYNFKAM